MRVPRTAFLLTGGGSHGAVQAGMLRALTAHGVRPDFLVGVSVGAVNAAYFAGQPSSEGVRCLEGLWRRLRHAGVFPTPSARTLHALGGRSDHMVDPMPLRRLLERHIPYRRLEEARVPVHVIATDPVNGSGVQISAGPVVDAVLASAALPGAFPPVRVGGRMLVDGAAASRTPVRTALTLGATRIVVLPTDGHSVALAAGGVAEVAVVPPVPATGITPYDFSHSAELIERAAYSTERWLASGALDTTCRPTTTRVRAA